MKFPLSRRIISTPLGAIIAWAGREGITRLDFADEVQESREEEEALKDKENDLLLTLELELGEYFTGTRRQFSLPLKPTGTQFQLSVWDSLLKIPFGETRSYKQQSHTLGDLKAIRAVASANGANPIALLIPCHRVIGSKGELTGYAGGLWRKKWLLEWEKKITLNLNHAKK